MTVSGHGTHRSFPSPTTPSFMMQTWQNLLFAHWPVSVETIRPLIHPPLDVDTYDGDAWVSIVAFQLRRICPFSLSCLPLFTPFPEINLRTYVTFNGKPGVYFISLDATNRLAITLAKKLFFLPYMHANIHFFTAYENRHLCHSLRTNNSSSQTKPIRFHASYNPTSPVYYAQKNSLEHWLTERYCFYCFDAKKNMYCGDIHHKPWPLQKAKATIYENTIGTPFHLGLDNDQPLMHYAKKIKAYFWPLKKVTTFR